MLTFFLFAVIVVFAGVALQFHGVKTQAEQQARLLAGQVSQLTTENNAKAVQLTAAATTFATLKTRFGSVMDVDEERQKVENEVARIEAERAEKAGQLKNINKAIKTRTQELADLDGLVELHQFAFYELHYDFGSSAAYLARLDEIRQAQKVMLQEKSAAVCPIEWEVNGSKAEGRKQINQTLKLMLRAFNGECDAATARVKYNNVVAMETRIQKAFATINSLAQIQQSRLTPTYLDLKIQELRLTHEYQEKVQSEREEQRRIREEMRQEEIARRDFERAQQEAEREEKQYAALLEKARQEVVGAEGVKQQKLREQIEALEKKVAEIQVNKERAISRAQQTKSGHVYVISNIGAFGEEVYKIGMTRRLEPQDRVDELGDASVPFRFDFLRGRSQAGSISTPEVCPEARKHGQRAQRVFSRISIRG